MFDNFSLVDLGKRAGWDIAVREKGWKSPFAIPTAEAVVLRRIGSFSLKNLEFAVAKREKGALECMGMYQVKWGTVAFPKHETAVAALLDYLSAGLGIRPSFEQCVPIGTLGPWLWKSTIALYDNQLVLTVLDDQAEKETPFYASLFYVDATGLGDGKVSDAFSDLRWMPFEELITIHGGTTTCIYWQAFFMAIECLIGNDFSENFFKRTWKPGKYNLPLGKSLEELDPDRELHEFWDRDAGY